MGQSTEKTNMWPYRSTNLNFKQVVGCQVFWPLKLWYFVWHVLKTKDTKSCRLLSICVAWHWWHGFSGKTPRCWDNPRTTHRKMVKNCGTLVSARSWHTKFKAINFSTEWHHNMKVLFSVNWQTSKQKFKFVFLVYYNNSHTRNSVTMSCNSVTEQNMLIANNQYT